MGGDEKNIRAVASRPLYSSKIQHRVPVQPLPLMLKVRCRKFKRRSGVSEASTTIPTRMMTCFLMTETNNDEL